MTAEVIDGRAFAERLRARVAEAVPTFSAATHIVCGPGVVGIAPDATLRPNGHDTDEPGSSEPGLSRASSAAARGCASEAKSHGERCGR